jgi:capping protein alpha
MSDDDGEYEEASPEQKLNISTYFMMSSPTGEMDDVVADVRKLVDDDSILTDEAITRVVREYNLDRYTRGKRPDGEGFALTTPHGRVSDNEFLDPSTGKVLKFDHRKRKFTEDTGKKQTLKDSVEKDRKGVEGAVASYVETNYKTGKCQYAVYGADDGTLTVCLSGANVHLGAYYTGGWKATYTIKNGELKGVIKVNVHYFEDGNVQMHSDKEGSAKVSGSGADLGKQVVAAIEKIESAYQNSLEEMYVKMHSVTFKSMRRFLPISRTPMNWSTAQHSLAESVSNK